MEDRPWRMSRLLRSTWSSPASKLISALRRRGGPAAIAVADGTGKMDRIYLRNAVLCGAVATHSFCEAGKALLDSVDWLLRGRDAVIREVVW
jgi:hypothetical protein